MVRLPIVDLRKFSSQGVKTSRTDIFIFTQRPGSPSWRAVERVLRVRGDVHDRENDSPWSCSSGRVSPCSMDVLTLWQDLLYVHKILSFFLLDTGCYTIFPSVCRSRVRPCD